MRLCLLLLLLPLAGCVGLPANVEPVTPFALERYLGTWYEIARLDHSFERGLSDVTAHYALRPDGGVRVTNRGYSAKSGKWEEAIGKAYFVGEPTRAHLKVSFFGPFYGTYAVAMLDQQDYGYALVSGPDTSYLWLLARTPVLDPAVKERLLAKARTLGFDTDQLVFVEHGRQAQTPR